MARVEICNEAAIWDEEVLARGGHPLQLWEWGEVKAAHNWQVDRIFVYDGEALLGAAQILLRVLPGPLKCLAYVPRGPVVKEEGDRVVVLEALASHVKEMHHAVVVTIEPDWEKMPEVTGWHQSANTILIPRTLILDLTKSEEDLLAHMTKKTRQYIRKSGKEDVSIRKVKREELGKCLGIYKQTAERADFSLHDDQYYYDVYDKLGDHSPVFAAFLNDQPIAFLWLAISQEIAFELYGGVNDEGQRLRVNYTLKWHAITTMKKWGIHRYDFNGLLNDGVSTFKQGFADHENMLAGTYDKPLSPLYKVWSYGLPIAKNIVHKLKNR